MRAFDLGGYVSTALLTTGRRIGRDCAKWNLYTSANRRGTSYIRFPLILVEIQFARQMSRNASLHESYSISPYVCFHSAWTINPEVEYIGGGLKAGDQVLGTLAHEIQTG